MCWVMSTSATARSRVALGADKANVQASTTSPVVAAPLPPQCDRPRDQAERQHDRDDGVENAELFQIEQASAPRIQSTIDGDIEAAALANEAGEGAHQRHVADHVDHLAVDGGSLVGKVVMQRPAGGGQAEHQAGP